VQLKKILSCTRDCPFMSTTPADPEASHGMYLWSVNPLATYPGSGIRQVRPAFVDQLVQRILDHGWDAGSFPTVYEPIEGKQLRRVHSTMSASELQDLMASVSSVKEKVGTRLMRLLQMSLRR
jgi:hypothetical protein